jgi:hypothetical protein
MLFLTFAQTQYGTVTGLGDHPTSAVNAQEDAVKLCGYGNALCEVFRLL